MMGDLVPSGSKYTDADRRAAVVEYIVLGNDAEGVPEYVELRTPIKGRDLVIITGVTQDKARTQLGQPTRISSSSEGMQDLLKQFEQLAQQSREKTVVSEQ